MKWFGSHGPATRTAHRAARPSACNSSSMPCMKTLLLPLLALAAAAVAADGVGPYAFTLSGKAFDERCLRLEAGESIRYSFRSSAPVDFNIHAHRGNEVVYPVKQAAIREATATFRAEAAEDYCLMWQHAGTGTAKVEGTLERVAR